MQGSQRPSSHVARPRSVFEVLDGLANPVYVGCTVALDQSNSLLPLDAVGPQSCHDERSQAPVRIRGRKGLPECNFSELPEFMKVQHHAHHAGNPSVGPKLTKCVQPASPTFPLAADLTIADGAAPTIEELASVARTFIDANLLDSGARRRLVPAACLHARHSGLGRPCWPACQSTSNAQKHLADVRCGNLTQSAVPREQRVQQVRPGTRLPDTPSGFALAGDPLSSLGVAGIGRRICGPTAS